VIPPSAHAAEQRHERKEADHLGREAELLQILEERRIVHAELLRELPSIFFGRPVERVEDVGAQSATFRL